MNQHAFFLKQLIFHEELAYEWEVSKQIFDLRLSRYSSRSFVRYGRNGVSQLGDVRDCVYKNKRLFF